MRVRFFNTYEPVTTFYRDLVPFLVSQGHEVEIVMSQAEYRAGRDLDSFMSRLPGVKIFRTANLGMQPQRKISKALVMAAYVLHAALYSLLGSDVDWNIFLTQPPLFPLWGYVLARLRRQPYYCVVMDIYPELMIEYGMMRRRSVITRWLSWLSGFALRKAEGVVVIGRCMAARVKAMGIRAEQLHLIPNWSDDRLIHPIDPGNNSLRKEWGLDGKFVVLYSGNMGLSHAFDDILTVAGQLAEHDHIAFVFIGGGSRFHQVREQVDRHHLSNVLMFPFQDIEKLAHSLSVGDVHLVVLRENCTGLAVPSKAYGIMAAGRPMIYQGSADGEIARMIAEEEIGMVVPVGDVEGLKQIILKYAAQPELGKTQGREARRLAEGRYSRSRAIQQYVALLFDQVANCKNRDG